MTPRQVQSVLKVIECGSVNRAAEVLFLAPSSVSAQIKELSTELGVELFEPAGRGLILSAAGQELLPALQQFHNLAQTIRQHAQDISAKPAGVLRLYAPSSMCIYRLPALIESLQITAPELEIHLTHEPYDYAQAFERAEIDAAILVTPVASDSWMHVPLHQEPVVYVCHPKRWQAHALSVAQLHTQHLITTEAGCSYRVRAEEHFKTQGLRLKPYQAFSNVEVIRRCLLANMGIGLVPLCVVAEDVRAGRLKVQPVQDAPYPFYSWLVYPKTRRVSPKLQALIETVQAINSPQTLCSVA